MKDDWSVFQYFKQLVKRLLTVSGLAVAGSFLAVIRVLFYGPEFSIWPAVAFYLIAQFNDTGRWLIPPFVEKFLAAKYTNGGAPSTLTMTANQGTVSATVTPTEPKP